MSVKRLKGQRLTRSERLEVRRRIAGGESFEDVAESVRCTTKTVQRLLNSVGGVHVREKDRPKLRLSLSEREEILLGIGAGESFCEIARRLDRAPSTISREVNQGGGRHRYRAVAADEAGYRRARRPKEAKLLQCRRLRDEVESMLNKCWSPQQISARLVIEFLDDSEMRASHETMVPKSSETMVATMVRTIFAQPDPDSVLAQHRRVVDHLSQVGLTEAADHLGQAADDILTFTGFPKAHWRQICSNNPQERLNKEIRRRTNVVGIFPTRGSIIRLVGALLAEQHDERAIAPPLHEPRLPRPGPHPAHRTRRSRGGDPGTRTSNRLERRKRGRRGVTHTPRHWT